ncbi:hypothetical protein HYX12_02685, partial [Candidatus Woesearchaeota archaeon]|nr:hypothetical protein [Candidatus Woesearchaeota archaeon]
IPARSALAFLASPNNSCRDTVLLNVKELADALQSLELKRKYVLQRFKTYFKIFDKGAKRYDFNGNELGIGFRDVERKDMVRYLAELAAYFA